MIINDIIEFVKNWRVSHGFGAGEVLLPEQMEAFIGELQQQISYMDFSLPEGTTVIGYSGVSNDVPAWMIAENISITYGDVAAYITTLPAGQLLNDQDFKDALFEFLLRDEDALNMITSGYKGGVRMGPLCGYGDYLTLDDFVSAKLMGESVGISENVIIFCPGEVDPNKVFATTEIDKIFSNPSGKKDSNIYAYRLKNVKAELMDIIKLIEYVLTENFNTAWDKNLWADIFCYQYVRDVADWFRSSDACHKLGTIFALLNSLYNSDVYLYTMLLREILGIINTEKIYIPYFSAQIVSKYCPGVFDLDIENDSADTYAELLRLLFSGKACCHLEDDEKWQWVRAHYYAEIGRYVKSYQRRKLRIQ